MTPKQWSIVFRAGARGTIEGRSQIPYLALADALRAMADETDRMVPRPATDERRES